MTVTELHDVFTYNKHITLQCPFTLPLWSVEHYFTYQNGCDTDPFDYVLSCSIQKVHLFRLCVAVNHELSWSTHIIVASNYQANNRF